LFWQPEELSEPPDYQNSAQTKPTAIYIPNVYVCLIIALRRVVGCENEVGRSKPFCSDVQATKTLFSVTIYIYVYFIYFPQHSTLSVLCKCESQSKFSGILEATSKFGAPEE
jgi:hypothetical protein